MNCFHKITAVFFAILLLFSTSSFAINVHYCGDEIAGVSFDRNLAESAMEMHDMDSCKLELHSDNCCHTTNIVVHGQNELQQNSTQNLTPDQQVFVAVFFLTYYHNLFENLDQQVVPFKNYRPPLLVFDIQVRNDI